MDHECLCEKGVCVDDSSAEQWKLIGQLITKHRDKPGALIPVLEEVQGITGYLPEPVQRRVASGLSLPLSQVYGVTTFFLLHHEAEGRTSGKGLLGTALRRNEFQEEAFIGIIPREDD